MLFNIVKPVPPLYVNAFVLEVTYVFGDADYSENETYILGVKDSHNELLLKFYDFEKQYRFDTIPDMLPAEFTPLYDNGMLKRDEYGNWASVSRAEWFYYDEKGVKHFAEPAQNTQK